jgi:hypothetical protein
LEVALCALGAAHGLKVIRVKISQASTLSTRVSDNMSAGVIVESRTASANSRKTIAPSAREMNGKPRHVERIYHQSDG